MNTERLVTVKDVRERYGCSTPTARKYLRECVPHMESPLCATAQAFAEWESGRMVVPADRKRDFFKGNTGRVIVPRKREG